MGEYEPRDSRIVTQTQNRAPGEPARTGPQEAATRQQQGEQAVDTELEQDERGQDAEQVADANAEQALQREASMERDTDELGEAGRLDRND